MKRIFLALSCLLAAGCNTIQPGEVVAGVRVCNFDEDVDGSDKITIDVLHGGRYWPVKDWCTDYYSLPTREQREVWTKNEAEGSDVDESITFNAKDGEISVDVGLGWKVSDSDEDVIKCVTEYGTEPQEVVDSRVRDSVRNSLNMCGGAHTVAEIYAVQREVVFNCALERVQTEYNEDGLIITRLTLNAMRLPKNVRQMMDETLNAAQKAKKAEEEVNESRALALKDEATAQGEKNVKIAQAEGDKQAQILAAEGRYEVAQLDAKANREMSASYTSNILKYEKLQIERVKAEQWKGEVPNIVSGDGSTTFLMKLDEEAAAL